MSSANENPAADPAETVLTGANTYSTGGGGVTFAHRVAVIYLASMLASSRRSETNDLAVTSLAFPNRACASGRRPPRRRR